MECPTKPGSAFRSVALTLGTAGTGRDMERDCKGIVGGSMTTTDT
jgi:hypothetical protein